MRHAARLVLIAGAAIGAALGLLVYVYHVAPEALMFPWSSRTAPVVEDRPLPPLDLAAPAVVETATFAVG